MLSYYGYVDIPVIGDEARMRRFEETLRSMGMIVVEVNVSNTSRIYYTFLPIAREYPPDRSIWWARAIEDVVSKRRSEIYDMLLTEAKEMARRSFETVAVFQRGGAKMTVEMLRKGDGVGLTLPHYLVLMYAGEASKVMPLSNPSRPTSAISPWFPYLTPDEEFGYILARAANESLTWEDYQRERTRICWGATDGRALTDAYTYPGLWAGIKSGKINAFEKEIRDICTRFGELLTMRRTSPALALLTKTAQMEWGRHSGLIIWMEPHEQDGFRIFTATIDGRGWMTKIYIYVDVEPYDEFIKSIDTGKTVLIVENFSTSREYDSMYKNVIDTFWDLVYKVYYDGKLPAGYLYWGINGEPPRYEVGAIDPPRDPPKSFDYQVLFVAPGVSKAVG